MFASLRTHSVRRLSRGFHRLGPGAFGAARLTAIVEKLQTRLSPSRGKRPGRPTDANWARHPKIPMSRTTEQRLLRLADRMSNGRRKVSPMQIAAQLLEEAVAHISDE